MRRTARALGVAAAWVAVSVFGAAPAMAHASLVGSTPQDGAVLAEAPDEVALEFDTEVQPGFSQVAVLDAAENHFEQGEPIAEGATVTQPVDDLPPGDYTISFRVGSVDGHPVTGVLSFTVDAPDEAEPAGDEPARTQTADPGPAADSKPANGEPVDEEQASAESSDESGSPMMAVALLAVVIIAVTAAGVMMYRRRPDGEDG